MYYEKGVILSFDLTVNNLRKYYSYKSPQGAYEKISRYLIANGFEKLKDSDYRNANITLRQTVVLMNDFSENNKWFTLCLNKLNLSPNIPKIDISDDLKLLHNDNEWQRQKNLEYQQYSKNINKGYER